VLVSDSKSRSHRSGKTLSSVGPPGCCVCAPRVLTVAVDGAGGREVEVAVLAALRGRGDPGVIGAQGRGSGALDDAVETPAGRLRGLRGVVDAGRVRGGKGLGAGPGAQKGPEEEEGEAGERHCGARGKNGKLSLPAGVRGAGVKGSSGGRPPTCDSSLALRSVLLCWATPAGVPLLVCPCWCAPGVPLLVLSVLLCFATPAGVPLLVLSVLLCFATPAGVPLLVLSVLLCCATPSGVSSLLQLCLAGP